MSLNKVPKYDLPYNFPDSPAESPRKASDPERTLPPLFLFGKTPAEDSASRSPSRSVSIPRARPSTSRGSLLDLRDERRPSIASRVFLASQTVLASFGAIAILAAAVTHLSTGGWRNILPSDIHSASDSSAQEALGSEVVVASRPKAAAAPELPQKLAPAEVERPTRAPSPEPSQRAKASASPDAPRAEATRTDQGIRSQNAESDRTTVARRAPVDARPLWKRSQEERNEQYREYALENRGGPAISDPAPSAHARPRQSSVRDSHDYPAEEPSPSVAASEPENPFAIRRGDGILQIAGKVIGALGVTSQAVAQARGYRRYYYVRPGTVVQPYPHPYPQYPHSTWNYR